MFIQLLLSNPTPFMEGQPLPPLEQCFTPKRVARLLRKGSWCYFSPIIMLPIELHSMSLLQNKSIGSMTISTRHFPLPIRILCCFLYHTIFPIAVGTYLCGLTPNNPPPSLCKLFVHFFDRKNNSKPALHNWRPRISPGKQPCDPKPPHPNFHVLHIPEILVRRHDRRVCQIVDSFQNLTINLHCTCLLRKLKHPTSLHRVPFLYSYMHIIVVF